MLAWLSSINPELIAAGVAGLTMVGVILRSAISGYLEARSKMKDVQIALDPIKTAVAMTWDRDQVERLQQTLESIAESLTLQAQYTGAIAKAQSILSDNFQMTTQEKLDDLLDKLDRAEGLKPTRRR